MIDIIAGAKGKGKTKILIQQVNDDIKLTKGTIVNLIRTISICMSLAIRFVLS